MFLKRQILFVGVAALLAGCASEVPTGAEAPLARFDAFTATLARVEGGVAAGPSMRVQTAPRDVVADLPPPPPNADADRVTITGTRDRRTGSLNDFLHTLSNASCQPGTAMTDGETAALTIAKVPLQAINPSRKKIGELEFVAGYQLTSPDKRFGGLSGLDLLDNGNLLAVSDVGDFVWIDLAPDGLTPVRARIAGMRDAKGQSLRGTTEGDAEGLAINGGMALVSYERDHRVLAYDLGKCGAAARGTPIVFGAYGEALPDAFEEANLKVDENKGAEPLGVTSEWYMFTGIETKRGDTSPMSARPIEAEPSFDLRVGVEQPEFVGLDVIKGHNGEAFRAFLLHRSFSPQADNAIVITETDFKKYDDTLPRKFGGELDERSHQRFIETGWRNLAELNFLFTLDNFEGIAARELPDGRVRLFLISDDDFSASHRTLLMVFDLPKLGR